MRIRLFLMCVMAVTGLVGCGDETGTTNSNNPAAAGNQRGSVRIEHETPTSILFEAEDGGVNAPVAIFEDAECSGGKYLLAPEGEKHEELSVGGDATYGFTVAEAGEYWLWVRTRFCCACGNSLGIALDDEELGKIEDALFEEWHWVQLRARRLDLKQGVHTLTITNREDGAAFDQILLVRDADDWPTGIEKAGVAGRTSGVTASPTKAEPPAGEAADVAEK